MPERVNADEQRPPRYEAPAAWWTTKRGGKLWKHTKRQITAIVLATVALAWAKWVVGYLDTIPLRQSGYGRY